MNSTMSPNATSEAVNGTGSRNMPQQPVPPDLTDVIYRVTMLMRIFYPLIILVGTIGNVLSIIVLLKAKNRKFPTAMYLLALASSDLLILWTSPLQQFIEGVDQDLEVRNLGEAGCRIYTFLVYLSFHMSSWLLVAVTIERILCTHYPHKVAQISTRRTAGVVIAVMFLCFILLNGHFLFVQGPTFVLEDEAVDLCYPISDRYRNFALYGWPLVDFSVAYMIPFLFIAIGNVAIILKLIRNRTEMRQMSFAQDSTLKAREEGVRSVMVMLVLLSVLFFFTMSPKYVAFVGRPYLFQQMEMTTANIATVIEAEAAIAAISYLNATWNFYLYCLSGSRFRKDVCDLLCCKRGALSQESMFDEQRRSA